MHLQRWQWFAIFLFLAALVARLVPGPRVIDDAYITFRYAQNLLAGNGFAFNAGERVLGTTTPLFTLLLAAVGFFTFGVNAPFPQIALVISAIADGLAAVLLFLIGRKLNFEWAGAAAALAWTVAPYSVTFAIGGLETSFYVCLLLAICWTYLEKRFTLAAVLSAAALLTRPDALLLILPLAFDRLLLSPRRGDRRVTWKEAISFLAPLLLWVTFSTLYFGSPIPETILAKSSAYRLEPLTAMARLLQHYATPFLEHLTFGLGSIKVGLVLFPFLALIGLRACTKREPAFWPFALFPWAYFAAFSMANPLIFRWYLAPPLPFYFLFILIGLEVLQLEVIKAIKQRFHPSPLATSFLYILPILLFMAPTALLLRGWALHPAQPPDRPAPDMAWIELELLYKEAAGYLRPQLTDQTTLAAGDVGVLGYFTQARILDLVGLNSKQTLPYYPLDAGAYGDFIYAISSDQIIDQQPDYLVILEIYGRYGLLKDERFLQTYQLLKTISTDIYGSDGLLIFVRSQ